MYLMNNCEIVSENVNSGEKFDVIESDLSLEKLLSLSKSFKTGVEVNLNKFKEEKNLMLNEISGMCYEENPIEESTRLTHNFEKQLLNEQEENSNILFWRENCETLRVLEKKLITIQESLNFQSNEIEFRTLQQEKEEFCVCVSSVLNKISDLYQMLNINQTIDHKSNYLKNILELKNKNQHWMDKYDELHDKYLRLEYKYMNIEKENCGYQVEISRVKMVEDENLRLHQTIDKLNHVRKELEMSLESCHEVVYKYKMDVEVARNKVIEAVDVVEKTCSEKEQLEINLKKSNDEIARLENELENLIQDAGKRVNFEVKKVKTMYKDKLREANVEIEFLRTEKEIACNKTQQMCKEYEIINEKYTLMNQKYINEPDMYSKKIAILVQQIKEYEDTFENLITDVKILKETNKKCQESYARKKTNYTMEIVFLKDTAKSLEHNLNKAIKQISEDNEQIVEATNTIKSLEMEISKLKQPKDNFEQKNMQINELIKLVEAHKETIDMWRTETRNIVKKFNYRINQLKHQCNKLEKENIKLKQRTNSSISFKRRKPFKTRKVKKSNISSVPTST